jgi:hypothetical protein
VARTRTLTQLIADVRDRTDTENSQHVTDAQITRYLNQSIAALHGLIVEQDENDFTLQCSFNATAGAEYSNIEKSPGDPTLVLPYKILAVDVVNDNGIAYPVPRFMHGERGFLDTQDGTWGVLQRVHYQWRGTATLYWSPPWESQTLIRVTYVPSPADLVLGSDTYDGRTGWEEWVTLDASIRVLLKEESDVSDFARERATVEARILRQITSRDRANPKRVRDVFGGERW